jgi:hypothetical protein
MSDSGSYDAEPPPAQSMSRPSHDLLDLGRPRFIEANFIQARHDASLPDGASANLIIRQLVSPIYLRPAITGCIMLTLHYTASFAEKVCICVAMCEWLLHHEIRSKPNPRLISVHVGILESTYWSMNAPSATQHAVCTARRQKYKFGRCARLEQQPTARQRGLEARLGKFGDFGSKRPSRKTCSITTRAWSWRPFKRVFMFAILAKVFSKCLAGPTQKDGVAHLYFYPRVYVTLYSLACH